MSTFSGLLSNSSVLGYNNNNYYYYYYNVKATLSCQQIVSTSANTKWIPKATMQSFNVERIQPRFAMSRGGNYGVRFDGEDQEDPYWLHLVKESVRGLKTLLSFLIQQPEQLKYIEWPSFKDTLRTASLTLVLVAVLIVALATIDSALSFILAILVRKPA